MDDIGNEMKKRAKKVLIKTGKKIIVILLIIIIIVVLLAASVYFITIDDGTYKEDDWGNTNYSSSQYINNVSVNEDGTLGNETTTEELWDKMIKNGCRVNQYLDSPEELARLMKAEIVTQYPDTRDNPDDPINWDDISTDPNKLQGIVKFKRADNSNNVSTMKYASPDEFQGYIDEYNSSGSESAKNKALTHFTLKKSSTAVASGNTGAVAAGDGVMTDVSQAIINATNTTGWPGASLCAKWVNDVYTNAGLSVNRSGTAFRDAMNNVISTDRTAIPIGAALYATGQQSGGAGHVGIYIGSGKVVDSISTGIKTWDSIDSWLSWQTDSIEGYTGWIGWGWADGNKTRGTTQDSNVTNNTQSNNNSNTNNSEKAVEKEVSGDGYRKEYTSSAGITYKAYKQIEGSYSQNAYWDRNIYWSGCGPTSVAILASGLLDANINPGDIAQEMNTKYGYTSSENLKAEMDSLGMPGEISNNPTGELIQNNLRNGKVMLVSVNGNTKYTSDAHIMAIVDINSEGQVYLLNPSSNSESLNGWTDISEIVKGCKYIVSTDAGAAGIASSTNTSNYVAVVATWSQSETTIETNDPNVDATPSSSYSMTTTSINYQEMVKPYAVPFDLLWAFLVVGEDKKFVLELADLIYNSDVQITVYDNKTVNTDINSWQYTNRTKAIADINLKASYYDRENNKTFSKSTDINNYIRDPYGEDEVYSTIKTIVTTTNTINYVLTKANVWCVDYSNNYIYQSPNETEESSTITQPDQEYPNEPTYTESTADGNVTYECGDYIEHRMSELVKQVLDEYQHAHIPSDPSEVDLDSNFIRPSDNAVTKTYTYNKVEYYKKYINITDTITNKISRQEYKKGTPEIKEKTSQDTAPNFVTIFKDKKNRKNKKNIMSVPDWLFEIIDNNDSTKEMLDLVKYLLYEATGKSFGVEEFDFNNFFSGKGLIAVGSGDYVVNIDMSDANLVIRDVNTLNEAFSGYSASYRLKEYASYFLEYQEKYRVNAVFAAAVSISETGAGRAGHAIDGKNNWFNIECTCGNGSHGRFETYSDPKASIERFFWQIAEGSYYFKQGNYTVSSIGMIYCENADAPGGWIENTTTYMTQMFNAAGISTVSANSTEIGKALVEAAKSKLGCPYVSGATGPNSFDCSGLTQWCYKQVGIDIPRTSEEQKNRATKKVAVSEARVGDILWQQGHVAIYIGNGQIIEAPQPNEVVKISNSINRFTYALQYY